MCNQSRFDGPDTEGGSVYGNRTVNSGLFIFLNRKKVKFYIFKRRIFDGGSISTEAENK